MRMILNFFIAALLIPMVSSGQVRMSLADIGELMSLYRQENTQNTLAKIDSFRKVVTVKDSLYMYLVFMSAELNAKESHIEEAIRDNEEIIKLSPAMEADAQMYIGQFKRLMGDFEGALAAYSRVLKLDKTHEGLYNNMANTYNSGGRYRDALEVLNSRLYPDPSPMEYYQYAVAYFNLNKLDSAKRCLNHYLADSASLNDFGANKMAAQICDGLGLKKASCEFIIIAMNILGDEKTEQKIEDAPARMKKYYFFKEMIKEIDKAKEIRNKVCG